jgi:spermidine synthase
LKKNVFFTPFSLVITLVYFLSGACSLTYEVIWQRLLKLTLGNTTYATSITVSVFMAGLAFGAFLIRKKADVLKNKLFTYGLIEIAVSLFALVTPYLLKGIDSIYVSMFQSSMPSPEVVLLLHIVISTIILIVPTILMGATFPILASVVVRSAKVTGWESGIIYSINTFGALTGVSITGFYTIRLLGVYPAYFIAVGLNVVIGVVSVILSRHYHTDVVSIEHEKQSLVKSVDHKNIGLQAAIFSWLFIMGFVALGYEIVWIRTVIHLLKAEIYTFSSVLCIYLLGYALGVFTGGRLAKKNSKTLHLFSFMAPLVGLCGILYIPFLTYIPDIHLLWNYKLLKFLLSIFGYFPHLYLCVLFFFLPSFFMGICFPLLVQSERDIDDHTGETVSKAYGFNTVGAVFGSIITGFILIPFFGAQKTMIFLGIATVLCGVSVLFFVKKVFVRVVGMLLPAACIIIVFLQPKDMFPRWINKCEGKGTYEVKLLDFIEGITTTASVHQYSDGSTVISTAGVNVAGDPLPLRQTQKMQGHFPIILHGNAQSVLTVGFGTGELTRTLTYHNIPDITCVEISPEMVKLSKRYFSRINLGNDLEKHVHMVYMDAKNYMHLTNRKFDVIENDCVWPGTFAESSSLYTKEYFMDARRHLNDNGLFSTWLTLDLPGSTLLSIIKTFSSVFENTLFIYPNFTPDRHILLLGQKNAHAYSYPDGVKELNKEKVRESLSLIGIGNLDDLLGSLLADNSSLNEFAGKAATNSDYFPFVEFDMNRTHLIDDPNITWENLQMMMRNTQRVDYSKLLSFDTLDTTARSNILGKLANNKEANDYLLESFCEHSLNERISLVKKGLQIAPQHPGLLNTLELFTGNRLQSTTGN